MLSPDYMKNNLPNKQIDFSHYMIYEWQRLSLNEYGICREKTCMCFCFSLVFFFIIIQKRTKYEPVISHQFAKLLSIIFMMN